MVLSEPDGQIFTGAFFFISYLSDEDKHLSISSVIPPRATLPVDDKSMLEEIVIKIKMQFPNITDDKF